MRDSYLPDWRSPENRDWVPNCDQGQHIWQLARISIDRETTLTTLREWCGLCGAEREMTPDA